MLSKPVSQMESLFGKFCYTCSLYMRCRLGVKFKLVYDPKIQTRICSAVEIVCFFECRWLRQIHRFSNFCNFSLPWSKLRQTITFIRFVYPRRKLTFRIRFFGQFCDLVFRFQDMTRLIFVLLKNLAIIYVISTLPQEITLIYQEWPLPLPWDSKRHFPVINFD